MGFGIYTATERVVRDGRLVCFAGEKMTTADAESRGLIVPSSASDAEGRREELAKLSADELRRAAEALGAECPKGATKQVLADAIIAKESA